jgi:hypothetical protein
VKDQYMHASSYENMVRCCEIYIVGGFFDSRSEIKVVELGSAELNGSYRQIFSDERFRFLGIDTAEGNGVDMVLEDPYRIPLPDSHADIVVSGQVLEHSEYFWMVFAEMMRILKPDGFLFLIVPSAGPIHREPVDCYRFFPDAYLALAKYTGCELTDMWHDDRGPWNDLVGVFQHASAPKAFPQAGAAESETWRPAVCTPAQTTGLAAPPEAEVTRGAQSYLDTLRRIHTCLRPEVYLEIGVRHGFSLALASARTVLGIDPEPDLRVTLADHVRIVSTTSDRFFNDDCLTLLSEPIDLAFIDGMHLFEFALRDFMNLERYCTANSVVVFDDIYPNHPLQAERERRSKVWTGDVWKITPCLRKYRPDLLLLPVDVNPAGLLIVAKLRPNSLALRMNYNSIVGEFTSAAAPALAADTLTRTGAMQPDDPKLFDLLDRLNQSKRALSL